MRIYSTSRFIWSPFDETSIHVWPQGRLKPVLEPGTNGNEMYSSNLGYIFNILSIWEKSVFSTIFVPVLRVFSRFTCKNGGFWVFFINIGHIHGRKKTTSTWHLILKILQWFSFDLKTPNPMLNRLQYMQYSHYLIKTIHHESWYCKIMKNKMKILSCQNEWINDLYTIPFSDLKKTKYSMSSNV